MPKRISNFADKYLHENEKISETVLVSVRKIEWVFGQKKFMTACPFKFGFKICVSKFDTACHRRMSKVERKMFQINPN